MSLDFFAKYSFNPLNKVSIKYYIIIYW